MTIERVHICGGAGSGKTTLARQYAKHTGTPHYELDDVYYEDVPRRVRRPPADRQQRIAEIVTSDAWVLEGIFWQPWVRPALERADRIVVLDIAARTRHARVFRRHFGALLQASPKLWPTFFPTLIELTRHNHRYRRTALRETLAVFSDYADKVYVARTNLSAERHLELPPRGNAL